MGQSLPKLALRPYLAPDTPTLAQIFVAAIQELTGDDYSEAQQEAWASAAEDEDEFGKKLAGELTLGPSPGTSALEVDLAFEADSLWIAAGAPNVAEHPWGPPAAGQKVYRPERRTLFVGLSPGTYTLVAHSWSGGEDGDLVIQRRIQVPAPGSVRLER